MFVSKEKRQMVTQLLPSLGCEDTEENTTVTQLSHWHGAPCSEEDNGLLKAQQQILIRTHTPT